MLNKSHHSSKPLTFEFFRYLTFYYFSLAFIITAGQIIFEYYNTKGAIKHSVEKLLTNFSDSLSNSLWEFNEVQTKTIIDGIYQSPYVTAIVLKDADANILYKLGFKNIQDNTYNLLKQISFSGSRKFGMLLEKKIKTGSRTKVGEIYVYSNDDVIFEQISGIIYYVLVNSVVKTIGLWLIILFLLRKKLSEPIMDLVEKIKKIDPKDPSAISLPPKKGVTEINEIIYNFNNLSDELKKYKDILEAIIENKTELLEAKNIEVKQLIVKLKDAQDRIIEQEKMNSLGLVSAGIAHELRNPLNLSKNAIIILKELIAKPEVNSNKLNQTLEIVFNNNARMETIITNMLLQGRKNGETPSKINLYSFISLNSKAIQKSLNTQSSDNCEIEINIPKSIHLFVYPHDLGRFLLNIFENALYAINERFKKDEFHPKITVSVLNESSSEIQISIKDNGVGIPENIKKDIMQPFFSTKPAGIGTGLGLYLSYDVIKQHKGKMEIKSKENKYTEIIFTLSKELNESMNLKKSLSIK